MNPAWHYDALPLPPGYNSAFPPTVRSGWLLPAIVATVLLLTSAPILGGMIDQWWTDEDMSHGILVPVAVAWIVWRERARWRYLTPCPDLRGIAVLALRAALVRLTVPGGALDDAVAFARAAYPCITRISADITRISAEVRFHATRRR